MIYKATHLQAMSAAEVRNLAEHAKEAHNKNPSIDTAILVNYLVEIYNFKVGKLVMRGVTFDKDWTVQKTAL